MSELGDSIGDSLVYMQQRKRQLQQERNVLSRELRNAERKRVRLVERARGLNDADLINIVTSRAAARSAAAAKAKGAPRAKNAAAKAKGAPKAKVPSR